MKAILLSAGLGSRLRPLTGVLPKCLLPVNGKPLLEYWFSMLTSAGVTSFLVNLHHLAELMKEWIELTEYAPQVRMVYEESLLGTGGTLFRNRNFAGDEPVMLVHADNLCSTDVRAYIDAHRNRPRGTEITMMTFNTPTPESCGIVETDRLGIVRSFHEKVENPPGNLANAAVYIVEPSVLNYLSRFQKPYIDFSTEVLPGYLGKINTFHNADYHRDIGNPESYLAAQTEFPEIPARHDGKKGWATWCKMKSDLLNAGFVAAIASAYKADRIDSDSFPGTKMNHPVGDKGRAVVVYFGNMEGGWKGLPDFIESGKFNRDDVILFIGEVPCGFSSRALFEKTRIRSIALCADGNSFGTIGDR